ncbi:hypothetical protein [Halovulum sp. GXIMD14793]
MLRRAWTEHRWLTFAFCLSLLATVLIAVRLTAAWSHWTVYREPAVSPWMTIGYVARSYDVHGNTVFEALREQLGLERGKRETIAQIAERLGKDEGEVMFTVAMAVRNAGGLQ